MVSFSKQLTQIIFFDLEFYVPMVDRVSPRSDLRANPFRKGHFLIGGSFIKIYPLKNNIKEEKSEYWIWDYNNEKEMLVNMISYFTNSWNIIKQENDQCDLIVCGIGISRVDIGYLFSKCLEESILEKDVLFSLFYQLRILELENIVIPFFKSRNGMLYPKTTKEMINKFRIDRIREDGKGIWEQYDNKEYSKIQERNNNEVNDLVVLYWKIVDLIVCNNIAPKYARDSYMKMKSLARSNSDLELIDRMFSYSIEEERYILNESITTSEKSRLFWILYRTGYMKE